MLRTHVRIPGGSIPAGATTSPVQLDTVLADALPSAMRGGKVLVDRASGGLVRATLDGGGVELLSGTGDRGVMRIAVPLPDYPSQFVELGTHGAPAIEERSGAITLV